VLGNRCFGDDICGYLVISANMGDGTARVFHFFSLQYNF